MKKTLIALVACLLSMAAVAQKQQDNVSRLVNFEANDGESFTVFIDGDIMNRIPQCRVMANVFGDQSHEVVVILLRPVQKAAVLNLHFTEPSVTVNVGYDRRTDQLTLGSSSRNQASMADATLISKPIHKKRATTVLEPLESPVVPIPAADPQPAISRENVSDMVARMKAQPYDSDRMALGKVMVSSADLTSEQIARLAGTFEYSTSKVEFLQFAYHYCIDPVNYHKTTDVLRFSSDKKRVLDYMASQK